MRQPLIHSTNGAWKPKCVRDRNLDPGSGSKKVWDELLCGHVHATYVRISVCVCLCAFPRCQPGDNVRSHLLSELAGMVGNGVPWLHKVGYTITSQRLICSGHAVMSSTARKC